MERVLQREKPLQVVSDMVTSYRGSDGCFQDRFPINHLLDIKCTKNPENPGDKMQYRLKFPETWGIQDLK